MRRRLYILTATAALIWPSTAAARHHKAVPSQLWVRVHVPMTSQAPRTTTLAPPPVATFEHIVGHALERPELRVLGPVLQALPHLCSEAQAVAVEEELVDHPLTSQERLIFAENWKALH